MYATSIWVYLFFGPLIPFVGHPGRIALFAAFWFAAGIIRSISKKKFLWPLFITSACWALFAPYESEYMKYTIRIDLILIGPVLLGVSLWGLAELISPGISFRPIFNSQKSPGRFSLRALMIVVTLTALALGLLMWLIQ